MPRCLLVPCLLLSLAVSGFAEETTAVTAGDLKLNVPASWKKEAPTNNLRLLQFSVKPEEGDSEGAEMIVTPPIGGSKVDNIGRWVKYFKPDGRKMKLTQGESELGEYIFVDIEGTYIGPSFTPKDPPGEGFRMYGVILTSKAGGNYFLRLAGPKKTVETQATGLRTAFGGDAEKEKEYALPE